LRQIETTFFTYICFSPVVVVAAAAVVVVVKGTINMNQDIIIGSSLKQVAKHY
jgi:hypothetical protein